VTYHHYGNYFCIFCLSNHQPLEITIAMPLVESIHATGATRVTSVATTSPTIRIDESGASQVTLSGTAQTLELELSGASRFNGTTFQVQNADVAASGASRADITVSEMLKAHASGASMLFYKGSPTTTIDVTGASRVEQAK
jgi:hypothetical protein